MRQIRDWVSLSPRELIRTAWEAVYYSLTRRSQHHVGCSKKQQWLFMFRSSPERSHLPPITDELTNVLAFTLRRASTLLL